MAHRLAPKSELLVVYAGEGSTTPVPLHDPCSVVYWLLLGSGAYHTTGRLHLTHTLTNMSAVQKFMQTRVLAGVPLNGIATSHAGVPLSGEATWVKVCSLLLSRFLTTTQR